MNIEKVLNKFDENGWEIKMNTYHGIGRIKWFIKGFKRHKATIYGYGETLSKAISMMVDKLKEDKNG